MVNDAASISTPEYFSSTFGVDAATAASLAQQAGAAGTRGSGLAQPPPSPVAPATAAPAPAVSPATPGAAVPSAQAEYDQIMTDRRDGKINNAQWHAASARAHTLAELIAGGAGNAPPSGAAPPADPMAQAFAPPSSSADYRFPYSDTTPTDEQIAADRSIKEAMFAAQLPRSAVESILSDAATAARALEANPASLQARLDSNRARMTEMWAREGTDFETAFHTINQEVARWPEVLQAHLYNIQHLITPIGWDQLLQLSKFRNRTRAA